MDFDQNIMLVDDDPTQTVILKTYLQTLHSQKILEVDSAVEAVKVIDEGCENIGLIVTDLRMPDMDGIEMLRRLKDLGYQGKIVIMSSLAQEVIESAKRLANLHNLDVVGACRKPITKLSLDSIFLNTQSKQKPGGSEWAEKPEMLRIRQALDNGEFKPFFQPQVDVYKKQIVGAEALVRWHDSNGMIISPAAFLPAIEEAGLTGELTFSILDQSLACLNKWQSMGIELRMAVNITARELAVLEFPDLIGTYLTKHKVDPSNLVLEVTENITLDVNATSLEVLSRLRVMGVQVAIDDFGTGYSNIKTLRDFPYTELKIDQSFVRAGEKDRFSQETVRTAVALGRQLNMRLLAEGVETLSEWEFVRQHGIDEVQGYLIAKPMSADDFEIFYQECNGRITFQPDALDETLNFLSVASF